MNLYPEMTLEDLIRHTALMAETVRQNYRLRASFPAKNSSLEIEIENFSIKNNKALSIGYRASVMDDIGFFCSFYKTNPIEAVDEAMKDAGITKVQQYIDLKNLTESLSKGAAQ